MQRMSGTDLGFAVAEMQPLCSRRIAKIRRTPEGIFLFKIGGDELLFQPGVRLHLSRQQLQAAGAPDGFVAFLRKALEGKAVQGMRQVPGERIVEIAIGGNGLLVFELFRKGNLALVGEDGIIAACLQKDEAGGRRVARGERYEYPKAQPYAAKLPSEVAFLVKETGKGGPVGYSCDAAAAEAGGAKRFPSFSEALDYYYANQRNESGAQKAAGAKIAGLEERLALQEKAAGEMEAKRRAARAEADAMAAGCARLDAIIALVREMKKKGAGEGELGRALAAHNARVRGAVLEVE